jgi:hypothetical protein
VILAALALAAAPASIATPQGFVERVYANYARDNYSPLVRPERVFAPALAAAIREDQRLSKEDVGFLDGDPICDCQDPAGLRARIVSVRQGGSAAATVRVALRFGSAPEHTPVVLRLVRIPDGWRIADVGVADSSSLLHDIQASNRRRGRGRAR